jgi:hypothetical protein
VNCSSVMVGCIRCTVSTVCLSCDDGFFLNTTISKCTNCSIQFPNCNLCNSTNCS